MIKSWLKKFLHYKFTFMLVPHGMSSPRQISVHLPVVFLLGLTWTGITFWGSYLSAQHVDYWRSEVSNQVLKMKVQYLLNQLDHSRSYLDEVKTVDSQLRELLQYKNKTTIIRNDQLADASSGGPALPDQDDLQRHLDFSDPNISWDRIHQKMNALRQEANARLSSYEDINGWIALQRRIFKSTPRGWPCDGEISSHYGLRQSPFESIQEYHPGIDISGPMGAPIRATADGIVRIASWQSGYGNLVVLQHDYGFNTRYGHNSKILVRVGDRVKRGQVMALMGDTGRASGVHCHYEVWRRGQRENPYAYLKDEASGTATVSRPVNSAEPAS